MNNSNYNKNKNICFGIFRGKKLKHYLISFNISFNKYLYMLKMLNAISIKIISIMCIHHGTSYQI